MSRNSEKANSLLHRYYRQQSESILPTAGTPRPRKVQSVKSIAVAEKFRSLCIREISTKITRINDSSINDYQIRDLNDDLNKLMKEKLSWEYHIRDLGGPDYITFSKKQQRSANDFEVKGYRYFGRSKELPDVKELIESQEREKLKAKNKIQAFKNDFEYIKAINLKEKNLINNGEYFGLYDEIDIISKDLVKDDDILEQVIEVLGHDISPSMANKIITNAEFKHKNNNYFKDNNHNELNSSLPKFEHEILRKKENNDKIDKLNTRNKDDIHNNDNNNILIEFDEFNPPNMQIIENALVEKRKKQLQEKLGLA